MHIHTYTYTYTYTYIYIYIYIHAYIRTDGQTDGPTYMPVRRHMAQDLKFRARLFGILEASEVQGLAIASRVKLYPGEVLRSPAHTSWIALIFKMC